MGPNSGGLKGAYLSRSIFSRLPREYNPCRLFSKAMPLTAEDRISLVNSFN